MTHSDRCRWKRRAPGRGTHLGERLGAANVHAADLDDVGCVGSRQGERVEGVDEHQTGVLGDVGEAREVGAQVARRHLLVAHVRVPRLEQALPRQERGVVQPAQEVHLVRVRQEEVGHVGGVVWVAEPSVAPGHDGGGAHVDDGRLQAVRQREEAVRVEQLQDDEVEVLLAAHQRLHAGLAQHVLAVRLAHVQQEERVAGRAHRLNEGEGDAAREVGAAAGDGHVGPVRERLALRVAAHHHHVVAALRQPPQQRRRHLEVAVRLQRQHGQDPRTVHRAGPQHPQQGQDGQGHGQGQGQGHGQRGAGASHGGAEPAELDCGEGQGGLN